MHGPGRQNPARSIFTLLMCSNSGSCHVAAGSGQAHREHIFSAPYKRDRLNLYSALLLMRSSHRHQGHYPAHSCCHCLQHTSTNCKQPRHTLKTRYTNHCEHHCVVQPPSIDSIAPVTAAASSLQRNCARDATSSTDTKRPIGCGLSSTSDINCSSVMPREAADEANCSHAQVVTVGHQHNGHPSSCCK